MPTSLNGNEMKSFLSYSVNYSLLVFINIKLLSITLLKLIPDNYHLYFSTV